MNNISKTIGKWIKAYWAYKISLARYKDVRKYEVDWADLAFWTIIVVLAIRGLNL